MHPIPIPKINLPTNTVIHDLVEIPIVNTKLPTILNPEKIQELILTPVLSTIHPPGSKAITLLISKTV